MMRAMSGMHNDRKMKSAVGTRVTSEEASHITRLINTVDE